MSYLILLDVELDIEVSRYPGDTDMVSLWVGSVSRVGREEGESLYEPDSEEHHLVPGQSLPHALSLAYSEGDQGRVFLIPQEKSESQY